MAFSNLTGIIFCLTFTIVLFGILYHGLADYASNIPTPPQLGFTFAELSVSKGFQAQAVGFQAVRLEELRLVYRVYGSSDQDTNAQGEVGLVQRSGDSDHQRISPGEIIGSGTLIGIVPGSAVRLEIVHKPSGTLLFGSDLVARA